MEGVIELAEEVFHMPVRVGVPKGVSGLVDVVRNPIYATGVGLLRFGFEESLSFVKKGRHGTRVSILTSMKNWFKGNF